MQSTHKSTKIDRAVAGRERKAQQKEEKIAKEAAIKEAKEAAVWSQGAKDLGRKQAEEAKRQEELRKKAERYLYEIHWNRERLLAEEEAAIAKKAPILRGAKLDAKMAKKEDIFSTANSVQSYSASNIDDAIDLLMLATEDSDSKDKVDRHPERRVKSAYAAFEERETPRLKLENPHMRHSQLKQQIQKLWKKSPDNPMNQQHLAYNASKEEEKAFVTNIRDQKLELFKSGNKTL